MKITNDLDENYKKLQWKMVYKFEFNEDKRKFIREVQSNFPLMKIIA